MNKFLILMVSIASLTASFSAFADQTCPANQLCGADADEMYHILDLSGMRMPGDVTLSFASAQDPYCVGENYNDSCYARPADQLPAASYKSIDASSAQKFWSLLKKAGAKNGISQVADGSAGDSTINASRIDCELYSNAPSQDFCTIKLQAPSTN